MCVVCVWGGRQKLPTLQPQWLISIEMLNFQDNDFDAGGTPGCVGVWSGSDTREAMHITRKRMSGTLRTGHGL